MCTVTENVYRMQDDGMINEEGIRVSSEIIFICDNSIWYFWIFHELKQKYLI